MPKSHILCLSSAHFRVTVLWRRLSDSSTNFCKFTSAIEMYERDDAEFSNLTTPFARNLTFRFGPSCESFDTNICHTIDQIFARATARGPKTTQNSRVEWYEAIALSGRVEISIAATAEVGPPHSINQNEIQALNEMFNRAHSHEKQSKSRKQKHARLASTSRVWGHGRNQKRTKQSQYASDWGPLGGNEGKSRQIGQQIRKTRARSTSAGGERHAIGKSLKM
jgi:hypothetical protein